MGAGIFGAWPTLSVSEALIRRPVVNKTFFSYAYISRSYRLHSGTAVTAQSDRRTLESPTLFLPIEKRKFNSAYSQNLNPLQTGLSSRGEPNTRVTIEEQEHLESEIMPARRSMPVSAKMEPESSTIVNGSKVSTASIKDEVKSENEQDSVTIPTGTKRKRASQNIKKGEDSPVKKEKKSSLKQEAKPTKDDWRDLPHGLGKEKNLSKTEKADLTTRTGAIKKEPQDNAPPRKRVKREKDSKIEDDNVIEEEGGKAPPSITRSKRTPRKQKLDKSVDGVNKDDDLASPSGTSGKKERTKKHPYGLTPGITPFPEHAKPTPEDCKEVVRLLSKLHGEIKAPEQIRAPSMEVAGCGEVPDLLDAVIRTRLSASTTANNANAALKGLKDTFGLRKSGLGKGSVDWEAVHKADASKIIKAIECGGLATTKGNSIKSILDIVHAKNCARRDALLEEKETGEPANIPGAENATQGQKDAEIAKAEESLLSMDYVFEMSNDEAMEELTKLPGIGVKTASCAMLFCMKRPSFAVDTHVWRHCKWLGWVPPTATRDQTFSHCEVRIPNELKYSLHYLFVKHGKTCGRCRGHAREGTKDWNDTECPIDHLITR